MSTIVNARDVELQATSPRVVTIAGPSNVTTDFANVNGVTRPSNNADVTQAAITGTVTVSGGGITLSSGGSIKGGQTAYDTGTGFFLGYSSSLYRLSVGNSAGPKMTWDGSALGIVGDIVGSSNLNITGQARFKGVFSGAYADAAVYINESNAASVGAFAQTSANSPAIFGKCTHASGGYGLYGEGNGGVGAQGVSLSASSAGVRAVNTGGGPALEVVTSFKWGSYTYSTPAGSSVTCMHNDGVWRDPVTNARVNSAFGVSASGVVQVVVGDTGTATASGSGMNIVCGTGLAGTYQFACAGNNIVLQTVSDIRLKQDINDETLGLAFVESMRPVSYRMKANPAIRYHGFIADHVHGLVPYGDSLAITNDNGLKGLDYTSLHAILVLAIQQLAAEVRHLKGTP